MLKSSAEFVELLQGNSNPGNIYSLDVESLFTNVPVNRTIKVILENVYNHPTIPPPPISKLILQKLLLICTTEVPFRDIDGNMYIQTEGVAMGSPLGPTFANFFMTEVENKALENILKKPGIYCRYIDDIFLLCDDQVLETLKNEMMLMSGLNFTAELAINNKLPFLNVLVENTEEGFHTIVYRKPTDVGSCMNAAGDSPRQYRLSVIKGFLHRAKSLCSEQTDFIAEIKHAKQILINNGYTNSEVDTEIRRFLTNLNQQTTKTPENNRYVLYFRNYMNTSYQHDERSLKEIITDNISMKNKEDKLQLVIYYKSLKTCNMVIKNNLTPKPRELAKHM